MGVATKTDLLQLRQSMTLRMVLIVGAFSVVLFALLR